MKTLNIGSGKENDILVPSSGVDTSDAIVIFEKGRWYLVNKNPEIDIFVNSQLLKGRKELMKYDWIKIGHHSINWSNYLFEGEEQELELTDLFRFNGRVSRSNFRFVSILLFGVSLCVLFLPGLFASMARPQRRRLGSDEYMEQLSRLVSDISLPIYLVCYGTIIILFLLFVIRRMRDTKEPMWKLLIPIVNLNLLYNRRSKD